MRNYPTPARTLPYRLRGLGYLGEELIDWITDTARETYASAENATEAALNDFRNKVAQFQAAYAEMLASAGDAYAVGMGDDYQAIKSIMDKVRASIDGVVNGYSTVRSWMGLGFLPIIGAAVIAGVVAAIVYALNQYTQYRTRLLDAKQQLIREGKLDASSLDSPSVIGEAGNLLKWGIVGALFILAYPHLEKALRK